MFPFDIGSVGERREAELAARLRANAISAEAVSWDPKMKFQKWLKIKGSTYKQHSLFEVDSSGASESNVNASYKASESKRKFAISPSGRWCYRERILQSGAVLQIYSGNRRGMICFDADVLLPMLHRRNAPEGGWGQAPWMSLTPMEHFSLRPGVRMARGHTVVAGLGLGYQLERVCAKRNVKKVTLVEEDEELVKWILPKIDLHGTTLEAIIGDAHLIIPNLEADVALIDIFPNYGGNSQDWEAGVRKAWKAQDQIGPPGGRIGKTWIWGA